MKAPCSFERFVRKLFINEEGLPLNEKYIYKVNFSQFIKNSPTAHFTCATALSFMELYQEDIAKTDGFSIQTGKIALHIKKLYSVHNNIEEDDDFLCITSNWNKSHSREYFIELFKLREFSIQYMPKKKSIIILPKEKDLLQGENQSSRFDIMDWDD